MTKGHCCLSDGDASSKEALTNHVKDRKTLNLLDVVVIIVNVGETTEKG